VNGFRLPKLADLAVEVELTLPDIYVWEDVKHTYVWEDVKHTGSNGAITGSTTLTITVQKSNSAPVPLLAEIAGVVVLRGARA
jgi:hypothetical protein